MCNKIFRSLQSTKFENQTRVCDRTYTNTNTHSMESKSKYLNSRPSRYVWSIALLIYRYLLVNGNVKFILFYTIKLSCWWPALRARYALVAVRRSVRRLSSVPWSYHGHPVKCCKRSPAVIVINLGWEHVVRHERRNSDRPLLGIRQSTVAGQLFIALAMFFSPCLTTVTAFDFYQTLYSVVKTNICKL